MNEKLVEITTGYALKKLIRQYSVPVIRGEDWSDRRYRKAVSTRFNALQRYRRQLAALLRFGRAGLGLVSRQEADEILADHDFSQSICNNLQTDWRLVSVNRAGRLIRLEKKTEERRK